MHHELLLSIHKYFVVDLNASKFNFELLMHFELMLWEATCIFIIWLMLRIILIKYRVFSIAVMFTIRPASRNFWSKAVTNRVLAFTSTLSAQLMDVWIDKILPWKMSVECQTFLNWLVFLIRKWRRINGILFLILFYVTRLTCIWLKSDVIHIIICCTIFVLLSKK